MNLSSYKRKSNPEANPEKAGSTKKPRTQKPGSTKTFPREKPIETHSVRTESPLKSSTEKQRSSGSDSKASRSDRQTQKESTDAQRDHTEQSLPAGPAGQSEGIRLNRYIAHCGVCSRREADQLIADGKIMVNKKLVTEMGFKVMPGDKVFMGKNRAIVEGLNLIKRSTRPSSKNQQGGIIEKEAARWLGQGYDDKRVELATILIDAFYDPPSIDVDETLDNLLEIF